MERAFVADEVSSLHHGFGLLPEWTAPRHRIPQQVAGGKFGQTASFREERALSSLPRTGGAHQ